MKLTIQQLTAIIVALASVALLILAVPAMKAPIGDFFGSMVGKQTTVGNDVLASINASDFKPGTGEGGAGDNGGSGGVEDENQLEPGLYDANDLLLAGWTSLVEDYGLDVTKNNVTAASPSQLFYIMQNNKELTNGVTLVIDESVTSIGERAFFSLSLLKTIKVPDSVTSIGNEAFKGCSNLTKLVLGNGVKSIGNYAFANCTSLKTTNFPDSVETIGSYAFYECTSLESITIPDKVTRIAQYTFGHCDSLKTVAFGNGVRTIGDFAFEHCAALKNITLPNSLVEIGVSAFNAAGIENLEIPESVLTIDKCAFAVSSAKTITFKNTEGWIVDGNEIDVTDPTLNATNLRTTYSLFKWTVKDSIIVSGTESGITWTLSKHGVLTVSGSSITWFKHPNSTSGSSQQRPWEAYLNDITSVVLESGVRMVGQAAFYNCPNLKTVYVPATVSSIQAYNFDCCPSLASVVFEDTEGWYYGSEPIDVSDPVKNAAEISGPKSTTIWRNT